MVRDAEMCKSACDMLLDRHDVYIQPINYPTVARGSERLRITPTPRHTMEHIASLVESVVDVWQTLGIPFVEPHDVHIDPDSRERCTYPEIKLAAQ
jgi:5-aminolevulinate synthase